MARQHSVVNFMRDNHSYEFFKVKEQKEHVAIEEKKLLTAEQTRKLREKQLGVGQSNLVQQLNLFYQEEEVDEEQAIREAEYNKPKVPPCFLCKQNKVNHIVREQVLPVVNEEPLDEVRSSILNMRRGNCIEQVVFDP